MQVYYYLSLSVICLILGVLVIISGFVSYCLRKKSRNIKDISFKVFGVCLFSFILTGMFHFLFTEIGFETEVIDDVNSYKYYDISTIDYDRDETFVLTLADGDVVKYSDDYISYPKEYIKKMELHPNNFWYENVVYSVKVIVRHYFQIGSVRVYVDDTETHVHIYVPEDVYNYDRPDVERLWEGE